MAMLSSLARARYFSRYGADWAAVEVNSAASGTQPARWYSGRTARLAPWEAASRMYASARAKLFAGARG